MDLYDWSFRAILIETRHVQRHDRMAKFYWKLLDSRCVDCPYRDRYNLAVNMRYAARQRLKYAQWVNDHRGRIPTPDHSGVCRVFYTGSGTGLFVRQDQTLTCGTKKK